MENGKNCKDGKNNSANIYTGLNIKKESADIIVGTLSIILLAFIMIAIFSS